MRWVAVVVIGIAFAVVACGEASSRYTKQPTDACLTRHHVLLTQHSLVFTSGVGMPVTSVESFVFTGIPTGVVDNGTLLFADDAAAAKKAERVYFDYYVRYDVTKLHQSRKRVISALKAMDDTIGNAVVLWNNYPQTRAAKRILRSCLH